MLFKRCTIVYETVSNGDIKAWSSKGEVYCMKGSWHGRILYSMYSGGILIMKWLQSNNESTIMSLCEKYFVYELKHTLVVYDRWEICCLKNRHVKHVLHTKKVETTNLKLALFYPKLKRVWVMSWFICALHLDYHVYINWSSDYILSKQQWLN